MESVRRKVAVVGGGPAGLRAAEVAALSGAEVVLYDAMRSTGRKFLVAGKSGLNLSNATPFPEFMEVYAGSAQVPLPAFFYEALSAFDNVALREWAGGLGIETYAASSNKVFPVGMKAAPLLRRWVERLRQLGVTIRVRHRLLDFRVDEQVLVFEHDGESCEYPCDAAVLALGGGSWPSTGSDGTWQALMKAKGISVTPLSSANSGWECAWPRVVLEAAEGLPLKNLVVHAGAASQHGELVITRYGLEGGPVYRLGPAIRAQDSPHVLIDFKPTFTEQALARKMESVKRDFLAAAKERWKLSDAAIAVIRGLYGEVDDALSLAACVKRCKVPLTQPRPMDEAISSAGGVRWSELAADFSVKQVPWMHLAGEMLDWEAPTGGYLLQAAFATGTVAGNAAAVLGE
ncbi:NAD(P)/FAD-dependent oxidoreductase [Rubritalea marina]|uniref:NAD(P)/FAD-dependent oxidoreductase n=1 Tax=Rubritalea marina TaxID=361055 RepID=UPI00036593F1|nr:TIGR03862 family flavoprotein [Rubritalea marina]